MTLTLIFLYTIIVAIVSNFLIDAFLNEKKLRRRKKRKINTKTYKQYIEEATNSVSSLANELDIPLQSDLEGEEEILL